MRLVVEALSIDRGGRRIIEDVGFAIEAGGAVLVHGANGSGKSTLLAALAGLLPIASGAARLEGAGDAGAPLREYCHYVGHREALKPVLSLRETLAFQAALLSIDHPGLASAPLSVEDALDAVGLGHARDLPVATLSAGQRRRLCLARLRVAPRPLWLLDEPTTALDAGSQARLLASIEAHRRDGGIVLAATHSPLPLADSRILTLEAA